MVAETICYEREAETRRSVLIIIPFMEIEVGKGGLRLHGNIEDASSGGHVVGHFVLVRVLPYVCIVCSKQSCAQLPREMKMGRSVQAENSHELQYQLRPYLPILFVG